MQCSGSIGDSHCVFRATIVSNSALEALNGGALGQKITLQHRHDGGELDGVRPWRRGDTMRQVVWKKVARTGELVTRDEMFAATDTQWAPWFVAQSDNKKRARLNIISHLLGQVPYQDVPRAEVTLPKRQAARGYREPDYPYRYVAETY